MRKLRLQDNGSDNDDDIRGGIGDDHITQLKSETREGSAKRRKVRHYRSHLAALLEECEEKARQKGRGPAFDAVTEHIATLGPSAIDVSLSTLCNGMHDLDEGLHLLLLACRWLLELCQSRERFEAANSYLHRFLHLHSGILEFSKHEELRDLVDALCTSIDHSSEALQKKTQHAICLLSHFARLT